MGSGCQSQGKQRKKVRRAALGRIRTWVLYTRTYTCSPLIHFSVCDKYNNETYKTCWGRLRVRRKNGRSAAARRRKKAREGERERTLHLEMRRVVANLFMSLRTAISAKDSGYSSPELAWRLAGLKEDGGDVFPGDEPVLESSPRRGKVEYTDVRVGEAPADRQWFAGVGRLRRRQILLRGSGEMRLGLGFACRGGADVKGRPFIGVDIEEVAPGGADVDAEAACSGTGASRRNEFVSRTQGDRGRR